MGYRSYERHRFNSGEFPGGKFYPFLSFFFVGGGGGFFSFLLVLCHVVVVVCLFDF